MYKSMMICSVKSDGVTTTIEASKHIKLHSWECTEYSFQLSSYSPPELLGAAVRFAFTRCRGNGVDVVTKALFPNGVPNSLEEYLESVDPNYEKWLMRE
jgi:hypothetical protein